MVEQEPTIERLEIHLEGHHSVYFKEGEYDKAKMMGKEKTTKLLGYFNANREYGNALDIRYVDFPKYFTWKKGESKWQPRKKYEVGGKKSGIYDFSVPRTRVVSRMYNISPREGERYFLRTLLLHNSGATSFDNLRLHDGVQHQTFHDTCCAMGFLSDDAE